LKSTDTNAATSSSSQHAQKRRKVNHGGGVVRSRHFQSPLPPSEPRTRRQRAQAVLSSSPTRPGHATDTIVIEDEDDTSDLNDSSSKPDTLTTSSPDPINLIGSDLMPDNHPYSFDTSKPSPIHQFSSTVEEMRKSPTDGESTARLRHQNQADQPCISSRTYPSQSVKAPVTPTIAQNMQTDGLPQEGRVKQLVHQFEDVPLIDLRKDLPKRGRKDAMKPKQVSLSAPQSDVTQPSELRVRVRRCSKISTPLGRLASFLVRDLQRAKGLEYFYPWKYGPSEWTSLRTSQHQSPEPISYGSRNSSDWNTRTPQFFSSYILRKALLRASST
jgi:hypothetical protein